MRVSVLFAAVFAAVLCLEAGLAIPYPGLEPATGGALVARGGDKSESKGGNHRSSGQSGKGKAKAKEQTGYSGSHRNPDAPAASRPKVNEAIEKAPSPGRGGVPIKEEGDRPVEGETAWYNDHNEDGKPRSTYTMGVDQPMHLDEKIGRERWYGEERYAEYPLASDEEYRRTRTGTLGDTISAKDTKGPGDKPGATREEKQMAKFARVPVNHKDVGVPGTTVAFASTEESNRFDSPAMRKGTQMAKKDDNDDRVFRTQANPTKEYLDNYDPGRVPWVKGPSGKDIGANPPEREMYPTSESMYLAPRRDSGSDAARSDSPRSDGSRSSNHRRRTPELTIRSKDKKDRRDRRDRKRGAADQAAQAQSNAESSHPDTTAHVDFKQQYQDYLEAFDLVRTNATNLLMPIVEDMVEGSDSDLVWGMAWEIMSLADRNIQVMGSLFHGGLHACDWYEDRVRNSTDEDSMKMLLAVDAVLIDIYEAAWDEATEALEQAGYWDDLEKLENALVTNDTSVAGLKDDHTNTDYIVGFFQSLENSTLTAEYQGNSTLSAGNRTSLTPDNSTSLWADNSTISAGNATYSIRRQFSVPSSR
ncbi:MAG: hypothetical protein L6R39_004127 [Caloplaca ligustica]|nr:MAG: hypothetical protein L6R39_004127 [Caloplaca ligustica]